MKKALSFFSQFKKGLSRVASAKWGFTLIELIVVITIIGVITSAAFLGVTALRGKARNTAKLSNVEQIRGALQMYKNDNGFYGHNGVPTSFTRDINIKINPPSSVALDNEALVTVKVSWGSDSITVKTLIFNY